MDQPTSVADVVIVTSPQYAEKINLQTARYFFATNTPFNHAEHREFKIMCNILRPGYKPPSAHQIGGKLLDQVYEITLQECKSKLEGQTVSMCLDGWSNVHNEPIVACSIVTQNGECFLVDTVDTSGNSHTADYLKEVAIDAIHKTEANFGVKVRSFVTDNTGNVKKMRRVLSNEGDLDLVQYGCSAHMLDLLAEDVQVKGVKEHIMKVIKYFRNKHLPSAWYKQAGGKKLVIPQEVRWNTVSDSIQSYLDNRGILVQVCQDHREEIDSDIFRIVNDIQITTNAKDFMTRMIPIAVALDRMQRDGTTIAVAVEIWNHLEKNFENLPVPASVLRSFVNRRDMALQGLHYLANMLDPRFLGQRLHDSQKEQGFKYLASINNDFTPVVMALLAKSHPFPRYLFGEQFRTTSSMTWWRTVNMSGSNWPDFDHQKFIEHCEQLLTAVAATAGLERIFSSFGIVQSKLRNRLGNEKASKLVFMFKCFNQNVAEKKDDLSSWLWESFTEASQL